MKEEIIFTYSRNWEGVKKFRKMTTLLRFLRKIPEHELGYTIVAKKKNGILRIASYIKTKKGLLSVLF